MYGIYEEENEFCTHAINNANNMVFYYLPYVDTPSSSYWMIPGTWNED